MDSVARFNGYIGPKEKVHARAGTVKRIKFIGRIDRTVDIGEADHAKRKQSESVAALD